MAFKFLCLVIIVLNLIKVGVFDCTYPAIPNHGVGYIIGINDSRAVRSLQEDELFQFDCEVGWILSYDSTKLITCSGGVLRASYSKSFHPTCEKRLDLLNWKIYHDETLIPKEGWCDGAKFSNIEIFPENGNFQLAKIKEIRITLCESSDTDIYLRVNNFTDCYRVLRSRFKLIFNCEFDPSTTAMVNEISITSRNPEMIMDIVIVTRLDDYCGTPLIPVNGSIAKLSEHEFQYSCNTGLRLIGNVTATCDPSTGQWTSAPTCVAGNSGHSVQWMWAFISAPIMCLSVAGIILFKNIRRRNVPVETSTRYRNTVYPSYRDEVEAWKVAFFNRPDEAFY